MKKSFPKIYRRLPKKQTGDILSLLSNDVSNNLSDLNNLGGLGNLGIGVSGNVGEMGNGIMGKETEKVKGKEEARSEEIGEEKKTEEEIGEEIEAKKKGKIWEILGKILGSAGTQQALGGVNSIIGTLSGNYQNIGLNKGLDADFNFVNKGLGIENLFLKGFNKGMKADATAVDYYTKTLQDLKEKKRMIAQQGKLLSNPNYQRIFGNLNNKYNDFLSKDINDIEDLEDPLEQLQKTQELQSQGAISDDYINSIFSKNKATNNTNSNSSSLSENNKLLNTSSGNSINSTFFTEKGGIPLRIGDYLEQQKVLELSRKLLGLSQLGLSPLSSSQKPNAISNNNNTSSNSNTDFLIATDKGGIPLRIGDYLKQQKVSELSQKLLGLSQLGLSPLSSSQKLSEEEKKPNVEPTNSETFNSKQGGDKKDTSDKEKKNDPLKLQKIGIFSELGLNTIQGITSAIGANNLFRKYQKLKTPRLVLPNTVRGAELANTTSYEQQARNQTQQAIRNIGANTGNLQALIAGTTDATKQVLDKIRNIRENALKMYQQERQEKEKELGQLAEKQATLDYKYRYDETERLRKDIEEKIKLANATKLSSIQNILGISKNLVDLAIAKQKDKEKIDLAIEGLKTQILDELKQKPEYYYKTDANGNTIRTTPEEKRKMEQEALANVKNNPTYEELLKLRERIENQRRLFAKRENQTTSNTNKRENQTTSNTDKGVKKAQRGKKIKTEESVIDTILSNYVDLKHKRETALSLQRNKQIYDASKSAVDSVRRIFEQLYKR
jgi:hypothetical protein